MNLHAINSKMSLLAYRWRPMKVGMCAMSSSKSGGPAKKASSMLKDFQISSDEINRGKKLKLSSPRPLDRVVTMKQAQEKAAQRLENANLSNEEKLLDKQIVRAASDVSKILGNSEIKSDLLRKLLSVEKETFAASKPAGTLTQEAADEKNLHSTATGDNIRSKNDAPANFMSFDGMKVAKGILVEHGEQQVTQAKKFLREIGVGLSPRNTKGQFSLENSGMRAASSEPEDSVEFVDFYNGERLNIFQPEIQSQQEISAKIGANEIDTPTLPVWNDLESKHLHWLSNLSPRNGFEEMIQWTEQGKVRPFPVDNEFGFFEKFVPFHEHVFLDRHLVDDSRVPKNGPVRQFLDLVVLGLSKNPYMKLDRKLEHIEWYKEYFKDKVTEIERMKENEDSLLDN